MSKKDKKKDKFRASPFDYMSGGRIRKLGDRYGVDSSDYNINMGRTSGSGRDYKGDRDAYDKAVAAAAMRDYDTRRTMEAQAMSGKKKARKYAEGGFNNIEDVIKANNMRERWHKKAGNGGSFSSASDFAGQTMRAVERERAKQTAGYDKQYASQQMLNDKIEELKGKFKEQKKADEPIEYKDSDAVAAAKARLGGGDYDTTDSLYSPSQEKEAPTTAFREANKNVPTTDDRKAAVGSYLEQYKKDMIKGGRIGEARSSNLNNAFNTVIKSDI